MHRGRITLIVVSALGILSIFFPWINKDLSGLKSLGVDISKGGIDKWGTQLGIDTNYIYVGAIGFLLIIVVALLGDRTKMIAQGIPKMSVLVISGLMAIFHIFLIIVILLTKHESPSYGLYLMMITSLLTVAIPYVFNATGEFDIPSREELEDDLEDSAEIIEEKADEIEDNIEDRFDKDDDDKKDKDGGQGNLIDTDKPKK